MSDVYLRPLKEEDAAITLEWHRNPNIWRYTRNNPSLYSPTLETELAWIQKAASDQSVRRFVICLSSSDRPIGIVGLQRIDLERLSAGTFIFIGDESAWGKGYGHQALRQTMDWGIREFGLVHFDTWVCEENKASAGMYKKLGYRFTDEYLQGQVLMRRMFFTGTGGLILED